MSKGTAPKPEGEVRQSQTVRTFGPGAIIDLPEHSVLVGGLDGWMGVGEEIQEPRLVEKLRGLFTPPLPSLKLYLPPALDVELNPRRRTGITAWQFPEWFVTQKVLFTDEKTGIRSRPLVHRKGLNDKSYIDDQRKKHSVVPVRWVRACPRGHIGDISWLYFVHRKKANCYGPLWLDESGTTGDIYDITVRCACGAKRPLGDAQNARFNALGPCDGSRPWLGRVPGEDCSCPNRLLIRTASNAYYPRIMSVISLPDKQGSMEKAVNEAWPFIEKASSPDEIAVFRKLDVVKAALEGFSDQEIHKLVLARKGFSADSPAKKVKQVEMEILSSCKQEAGADLLDSPFFARSLPRKVWDQPWMDAVEKVVLVERLREVVAQVGFTRFDPSSPGIDGELEIGAEMAPLAREITWLPAVENRGEGIFFSFKKEKIVSWATKNAAVKTRARQLEEGFNRWKEEHPQSSWKFPGTPYIMLHSLSHLLITAMSLECGYPASAIRERVYADESGYGILLFTGSPDAEGTMGGLVEAGKEIHCHLKAALELGGLCSNDPVCAQHDSSSPHEHRFLHGAACHGCLLIAETSCEQFNNFLDRALVVPTVDNLGAEFFTL